MTPQTATISLEVEIPESLQASCQRYLNDHPAWGQDRLIQAALSLFLMQNGVNESAVNSMYLDSLYGDKLA